MGDKIKIDLDEKGDGIITEGANTGLGKILAAAGKVNLGGMELKVKNPKAKDKKP